MKPNETPEAPAKKPREIHLKKHEYEFIEMIRSGRKTLDLRTAYPSYRKIVTGDHLLFKSGDAEISVRVTDIREYKTLAEVTESENISKIAPLVPQAYIRSLANRLFSEADIRIHGLLVFEFERID